MPSPLSSFASQAKKKLGAAAKQPFPSKPPAADKTDLKSVARQAAKTVADGDLDEQVAKLMRSYDPEEDVVPVWAIDEETWQKAESAVQPRGRGKNLAEPWLTVAQAYKALGGKVQPGGNKHAEEDEEEPTEEEEDEDE